MPSSMSPSTNRFSQIRQQSSISKQETTKPKRKTMVNITTRSMLYYTTLGLLCLSSLIGGLVKADICPLCGDVTKLPVRFDYYVGDGDETCMNKYMSTAKLNPDSNACKTAQKNWGKMCCDDEEPSGNSAPSQQVVVQEWDGPYGDEPICPICGKSNEYPGKPHQVIQARYVGTYSCAEFYHRGLHGLTPSFMCGPLQDYAYKECGCGEYNPNPNSKPSSGGSSRTIGGRNNIDRSIPMLTMIVAPFVWMTYYM